MLSHPSSTRDRSPAELLQTRGSFLAAWFLFLALQESVQTNAVHGVYLVAGSRQVPIRLPFSTANTLNLHLIMFVYEVQSPVTGQEGCNNLTVLDQLCANALSDRTVRLTTLNTHLLKHDRPALRRTLQRVSLVIQTEHPTLERRIRPPERLTALAKLTSGEHTTRLLSQTNTPELGKGEDTRRPLLG